MENILSWISWKCSIEPFQVKIGGSRGLCPWEFIFLSLSFVYTSISCFEIFSQEIHSYLHAETVNIKNHFHGNSLIFYFARWTLKTTSHLVHHLIAAAIFHPTLLICHVTNIYFKNGTQTRRWFTSKFESYDVRLSLNKKKVKKRGTRSFVLKCGHFNFRFCWTQNASFLWEWSNGHLIKHWHEFCGIDDDCSRSLMEGWHHQRASWASWVSWASGASEGPRRSRRPRVYRGKKTSCKDLV